MKHSFLEFNFAESNSKSKSKRCVSKIQQLFAKNKNVRVLQEHEFELLGILDMVNGLEYHYKKFVRIEKNQRKHLKKIMETRLLWPDPPKNMIHEFVAYVNRLGQIYYMFISLWFKSYLAKESELVDLCPTILALMPFRNKFTAHRSIDAPRKETISEKENHASIPFVVKWSGPILDRDPNKISWDTMFVIYQITISKNEKNMRDKILVNYHPEVVKDVEIFVGETIFITFVPTKCHSMILEEIVRTIEKILT